MASDWEIVKPSTSDWQQVMPQQPKSNPLLGIAKFAGQQGLAGPSGQAMADANSLIGMLLPGFKNLPGNVNKLTQSSLQMQNTPDVGQKLMGAITSPVKLLQTAAPPAADIAAMISPSGGFSKAGIATGALRGELAGIAQGKNPIESLPYAGVGAVAEPVVAGIGEGIGKIAGKFRNTVQNPTQDSVLKAMQAAKDESVASGDTVKWDELKQTAMDEMKKGKYQYMPDFQKKVVQIFESRTPLPTTTTAEFGTQAAGSSENLVTPVLKGAELNANNLHDFRQALDAAIPQNAWNNPNIIPTNVSANQFVRQIIGDSLHQIVPKMQNLDSLYSLYSNPLIKELGLPYMGHFNYPTSMAGLPSAGINAGIATLLGETLYHKAFGK